jgi:hypothetical protein
MVEITDQDVSGGEVIPLEKVEPERTSGKFNLHSTTGKEPLITKISKKDRKKYRNQKKDYDRSN